MKSSLDKRIIGISEESIKIVPRRVAVAGGAKKFKAIKAAVLGGWVNVLITDSKTAEKLSQI